MNSIKIEEAEKSLKVIGRDKNGLSIMIDRDQWINQPFGTNPKKALRQLFDILFTREHLKSVTWTGALNTRENQLTKGVDQVAVSSIIDEVLKECVDSHAVIKDKGNGVVRQVNKMDLTEWAKDKVTRPGNTV